MPINAVNLTGNVYPAGPKGDTGPANTLEIGTVEKGEEASVTIVGESPNQILNFVLPIGPKGNTGEKGDQGPKGEQGIQGETGATTSLSIGLVSSGEEASATIIGEAPDQILNLVLPKGDKGEKGNVGPQGVQGIQGETGPANSLTIGTVEKGAVPSATITGEAPNQVLNLVLPTGETAEIEAIQEEQTTQNENIEKNAEVIATINEKIGDIDTVLDFINGEVI